MAKTRDLEAVQQENLRVADLVETSLENFGFRRVDPVMVANYRDKTDIFTGIGVDTDNNIVIEFASGETQKFAAWSNAVTASGFKRSGSNGFSLGDDDGYDARLELLQQKADEYAIKTAIHKLATQVDFNAPGRQGMLENALEENGIEFNASSVADAANFKPNATIIAKS